MTFFPALNLVSAHYSDGAGNFAILGTAPVDLNVNQSTWRSIAIDISTLGGQANIGVDLDGQLVLVVFDSSNTLTSGTVAVSAELLASDQKEIGLGATEVYQHSIETDKILPVS